MSFVVTINILVVANTIANSIATSDAVAVTIVAVTVVQGSWLLFASLSVCNVCTVAKRYQLGRAPADCACYNDEDAAM